MSSNRANPRQAISALAVATSLALTASSAWLAGCSSARKKTPELSEMEGKKVALIEIDGETTARSVVEVALVNQLVKHGSFEILAKPEVNSARTAPDQDPTDWIGIARRAGADYALRARVLDFAADQREGYSSEEVYDSQLAEERGEKEGKTQRLYQVKSLTGKVRVKLDFAKTDPKDPDLRSAVAEEEKTVTTESKNEAAHLPPKLRFLEGLANTAFGRFFDQYK